MSFALEFTEESKEDLNRLIDSLPKERRREAVEGIVGALETLAANPLLAPKTHLGRPTYRFRFEAGGTTYHWAATFCYSQDERSVVITQIFRYGL